MNFFLSSIFLLTIAIGLTSAGLLEDLQAKFSKSSFFDNNNPWPTSSFKTANTNSNSATDFEIPKLDATKARHSSSSHQTFSSRKSSSSSITSTGTGTISTSTNATDVASTKSTCTGFPTSQSTCEISATREFEDKSECYKSTYHRKLVAPENEESKEHCTKTKCDTKETVDIDCKVAFGTQYTKIEDLNKSPNNK